MAEQQIIIAIDGYSSCGKSTLAKMIARKLHYLYIDSGAMYRAATLYLLEHQTPTNNLEQINQALKDIDITFALNPSSHYFETHLNGQNVENKIRTLDVAKYVSEVSKYGIVREQMVKKQRELGRQKGIVMDGRDIGTVVFPEAELKIFMTADFKVRAQRRYEELLEKGTTISLEQVRQNLRERDEIDTNREISPLRKAEDALLLDTTNMTKKEELEWVCSLVDERINA